MGMTAINKMIMENRDSKNTVKINTGNLSWPGSVRESWAEGVTVKLAVKEEGKEREILQRGMCEGEEDHEGDARRWRGSWWGCTKVGSKGKGVLCGWSAGMRGTGEQKEDAKVSAHGGRCQINAMERNARVSFLSIPSLV